MTTALRPTAATGAAIGRPGHGAMPTVVGTVVVATVVVAGFQVAARTESRLWWPAVVAAALLATGVWLSGRASDGDRVLRRILVAGVTAKLAFSMVRLLVNNTVYGGVADASGYDAAGRVFLQNLQEGRWSISGAKLDNFPVGTRVVGYAAGVVYRVVGPSVEAGYLVFSFLAWLGLLAVVVAYRVARPDGNHRLAAGVLLVPSILYWPSSLGKDALLVFLLGACLLGVACLVAGRHRLVGAALVAPTGWLIALIRPHILLLVLCGLAAALAVAPGTGRAAWRRRALLLALVVPLLVVGASRMEELFGDERGSYGLEATLDGTVVRTHQGGSAFHGSPVRSPLHLPSAVVDVLLRPFPWEASSGPELFASAESAAFAAAALASLGWLWRALPPMRREPFVAFCGTYALMFVVAFSNVANAGILARQRVQVLPVLALLVVVAHDERRLHRASRIDAPDLAPRPGGPPL